MYLHIGGDYVVKMCDIVGIMEIENTSTSRITKEFLRNAEKKGRIINVSGELPKTFVLTCEKGTGRVYISPVSTATLNRRYAENLSKGMK